MLQVYWLAGREPGIALENPRQLSAYHYPRQYGPTPPAFSRAMLVAPDLLMISGTASIVGHASQHAGSVQRQTDRDLQQPRQPAGARAGACTGPAAALRRQHADQGLSAQPRAPGRSSNSELRERLPAGTPFLVLLGDVCRSDLLIELDCLHAAEQ